MNIPYLSHIFFIVLCAQLLSHDKLFVNLWTIADTLLCPWDSLGKNTGVGCHALLQGIFPTQGLNPHLLVSCIGRQILYHWLGLSLKVVLVSIHLGKFWRVVLCTKSSSLLPPWGWSYCCSVSQLCQTLCDPIDYCTPGFPVLPISQSLFKVMSIELVMPSNHLILYCPLFLLPSIFPSMRIFSNILFQDPRCKSQLFATEFQSIGASA